MPSSDMAIEAASYEAVTRIQFTVPTANERKYYYFPSRATSGAEAMFCCKRIERDPAFTNLI